MKIGVWCGLLFVVLDISVYLTPVECFTIPISVSTGMAIIIALVKIKAIIVKVLLGLKAMGVESFVWRTNRKRRSIHTLLNNSTTYQNSPLNVTTFVIHEEDDNALIEAWNDLQKTVGKVIEFDLESCTKAAAANDSKYKSDFEPLAESPWDNIFPVLNEASSKSYSRWVSKMLGSISGDPLACKVLQEELDSKNSTPASYIKNNRNIIKYSEKLKS